MMMHRPWVILMVLLILSSACDDDGVEGPDNRFSAQDTFVYDVTKASRRELNIQAVNGSITVTGSPGAAAVSIFAITRVEAASQADADARISQIEVEVDSTVDAVLIETLQPTNTEGRNYIVDYEISCPPDLQVAAAYANGSTIVRDLGNSVSIGAANSEVTLDNHSGSAMVGMANGSVDARITMPPGGLIGVTTGNGEIDLAIPLSTSAQFLAETANGGVTVVGLNLQGGVVEPNKVTGTLGDGNGTISLIVSNGTIYVEGF
jgi:hypothetical protein